MSKLIEQLKRHEGLRLETYRCSAGVLTIGYGHTGPDVHEGMVITEEEAEALLYQDVAEVEELVIVNWPSLDPVRRAVLINMAFNLGWAGLMKFKRMMAAVDKGDYLMASMEMNNSKWARQVGIRAHELCMQMATGKWQQ